MIDAHEERSTATAAIMHPAPGDVLIAEDGLRLMHVLSTCDAERVWYHVYHVDEREIVESGYVDIPEWRRIAARFVGIRDWT